MPHRTRPTYSPSGPLPIIQAQALGDACHKGARMLHMRARLSKERRRLSLRLTGRSGSARCAFLLGAQRSGTNMLLGALERHRRIECFNESDEEAFDNCRIRRPDVIDRLVLRSFADLIVLKPICDSQWTRRLLDAGAHRQAIWIYRDYEDVVNSALRQFTEHTKYLWYMLNDKATAGWRVENVTAEHLALVERHHGRGISDASARALIWYLRNALFFQQTLDRDWHVLLVRYEQLVESPELELQQVRDHLNIEFQPRMARSLFATSVRKHDAPDIDPKIKTLCHEMLDRLDAVCARRVDALCTAAAR